MFLPPITTPFLALAMAAQDHNPAHKAQEGQRSTYTMPGMEVVSSAMAGEETDLVGPYGQPRWTTRRLWTTTRTYVIPEGAIEFEFWLRPKDPKEGPTEIDNLYEVAIGLPGRFQLDLYFNNHKEGNEGATEQETWIELRYALADWGKLWGNPTLYGEVKEKDASPTVIEAKLLLGDQVNDEWFWGTNLVYEQETGGERESVYEITAALSHTTLASKWSWGAEIKAEMADTEEDRGEFTEELVIGPSFQFRPTPHIHLDATPMVGIGGDSPDFRGYFIVGYSF